MKSILLPNPAAGGSVFDFAGAAFATTTAVGAGIAAALDFSFSSGEGVILLDCTTLHFATRTSSVCLFKEESLMLFLLHSQVGSLFVG